MLRPNQVDTLTPFQQLDSVVNVATFNGLSKRGCGVPPKKGYPFTNAAYNNGTQVIYDYDQFGWIQQQIVGDGQQQLTYRYDRTGNFTMTDGAGAQTRVEYLSDGQTMQVTNSVGRKRSKLLRNTALAACQFISHCPLVSQLSRLQKITTLMS